MYGGELNKKMSLCVRGDAEEKDDNYSFMLQLQWTIEHYSYLNVAKLITKN